jgi:hypothetical protein
MKKFFSVLLAIILVSSQMSFTIGTHFCGGKAIETKLILGETNLGCEMTEMNSYCELHQSPDTNKLILKNIPCCDNEFKTIQPTDEYIKEADTQVIDFVFTITFIYTQLKLNFFPKPIQKFNSKNISPPEKDIQILFQTFLI